MTALPLLPDELKSINPYLQRGQELQKIEPVISYYCKYYAVQLAVKKGSTKESKHFLSSLLDVLEAEKKTLSDVVTNDVEAAAVVEKFGLKVFLNADNEDRAGNATKKTAKNFLAASLFLELMRIFGNIKPEIEEKIKYSKWKATDIMKAINNGQKPIPGPPGGELMDKQPLDYSAVDEFFDQLGSQKSDVPSIDEFPSAPLSSKNINLPQDGQPPPPQQTNVIDSLPPSQFATQPDLTGHPQVPPSLPPKTDEYCVAPPSQFQPSAQNPAAFNNFSSQPQAPTYNYTSNLPSGHQQQPVYYQQVKLPEIDANTIALAQKHSKWAISALNFNDVKTAVENLRKALSLIEPYNTNS